MTSVLTGYMGEKFFQRKKEPLLKIKDLVL